MKLSNNKIIITGATRGIGKALLKKFYALDNQIIAVARNEQRLAALQQEFPKITTIVCDLSDENSVDTLIKNITTHHKNANTLINNAGIQVNFYDNKFGEKGDVFPNLKNEMQINYATPVELCYRLIPTLIQNENASIVNVTSALAFVPKQSSPVYCGTKAALHIFSKSLRYQYQNENLKIFELIPPLVATDMTKGRGSGKMPPEQLVNDFIKDFKRNRYESNIGKTKPLRVLQRIAPRIADNILRNS